VGGLGHEIVPEPAPAGENAEPAERRQAPSLVLFELLGRTERHFASLRECVHRMSPLPVVVVVPDSEAETIVRALQSGAAEHVVFQDDSAKLEQGLLETLSRLAKRTFASPFFSFICASPAMRAIEKTARQLASLDVTVLITGESGTGKEVIARYVHQSGSRSRAPFVSVNCAAVPDDLLESELFGYEKGAFTGAVGRKVGKFQAAHLGSIFLDEISEMSTHLQAKLLHVLQDKRFTPLGATRELSVDVRVIAATNRNLERDVAEGRFREDLYFRLKVIELEVPPLRARPEEIPLFIEYFLIRYARQYQKPVPELSERLLQLLMSYRWLGNVRELENLMKRLVILGDEGSIVREIVSRMNREAGAMKLYRLPPEIASESEEAMSLKEVARGAARAAERDFILRTLWKTNWNRRRAARILGVSYKTLLTKITELALKET
jgi:DNA-binding NtrC family response regulator